MLTVLYLLTVLKAALVSASLLSGSAWWRASIRIGAKTCEAVLLTVTTTLATRRRAKQVIR